MQKKDIKIGLEVWAYTPQHLGGLHTQIISRVRKHDKLGEVVTCAMIGTPVPIKFVRKTPARVNREFIENIQNAYPDEQ